MKKILLSLPLLLVGACSITVPVVAKIDHGGTMQGSATGALTGGTFEVRNLDGLSCMGTYDALDESPTITGDVTCSDGRHGKVLITRDATLRSGSGHGKMNDGTTFKFMFGHMVNVMNY